MATADNTLKTCSNCGESKLRSMFFRCRACKDGLRGESESSVAAKQKHYNKLNAESIRQQKKRRYWENPEERRARSRQYAKDNADAARLRAAKWREDNLERAIKSGREYYHRTINERRTKAAEYRERNRGELRAAYRKFYKENKERLSPQRRAAKARRRSAEGVVTAADIRELLLLQRNKCAICKTHLSATGYHVDHIKPIARGGTNFRENLQILCPPCNLSKQAKDPIEYMQELGFLL